MRLEGSSLLHGGGFRFPTVARRMTPSARGLPRAPRPSRNIRNLLRVCIAQSGKRISTAGSLPYTSRCDLTRLEGNGLESLGFRRALEKARTLLMRLLKVERKVDTRLFGTFPKLFTRLSF